MIGLLSELLLFPQQGLFFICQAFPLDIIILPRLVRKGSALNRRDLATISRTSYALLPIIVKKAETVPRRTASAFIIKVAYLLLPVLRRSCSRQLQASFYGLRRFPICPESLLGQSRQRFSFPQRPPAPARS